MCPKCPFADISTAIIHTHFFLFAKNSEFFKGHGTIVCVFTDQLLSFHLAGFLDFWDHCIRAGKDSSR